MNNKLISIIIPVLNEEKIMAKCLAQFKAQPRPFEIVVVDGGSLDRTKELVRAVPEAKLIESAKGRGRQMNAGAKAASGEILLFLHSDTTLPPGGLNLIRKAMAQPEAVGGYFRLAHDQRTFWYERFSFLINWRSRLPNITPYGDQAIFCGRSAFQELKGYKEIPLMEDYDFAKRLKTAGRLVSLDEKVTSSARRYARGALRYMLQCNLIWLLHHLGVSPEFLQKLYKDVR